MPIIILEGPDGQGKSTLARLLVNKFNGYYMHASYHTKMQHMIPNYIMSIVHKAAQEHSKGRLVVIDRLIPSCCVYEKVYRENRNKVIVEKLKEDVDKIMIALGVMTYFILPEEQTALDYYLEVMKIPDRKEMYTCEKKFIELYREYLKYYQKQKYQFCHRNVKIITRNDFYNILKQMENTINV